ncbi:MAG: hypothetical protein O7B81_05785 [Gammaproteobacteria bacterium]|nr:hypothetical protein [Gammaproteobacteria bacterium]
MLTILVLVPLTSSFALDSNSPLSEILDQILDGCIQETGYDRSSAAELGDYELGALEKPWRECVYQGARVRLMPSMRNPQAIERAIAKDRQFTMAIEKGAMKRHERWQENRAAIQMAFLEEDLARVEQQQRLNEALDEAQRMMDEERMILHSVIRGFRF